MLKLIKLKDLKSIGNVRKEQDEELLELANDIKKNGLLQPIVVREGEGGKYEIIAGHRRFAALKMINEELVECNVIDAGDSEITQLQLVENVQRKNMSAFELVEVFEKLGKTQAQIAKMLNKSQAWVNYQYAAVRELESVYGKYIPEEQKTKSASTIIKETHGKRVGDVKTTSYKGFKVTQKGHQYIIMFDTFEAEKEFKNFIKGFKL